MLALIRKFCVRHLNLFVFICGSKNMIVKEEIREKGRERVKAILATLLEPYNGDIRKWETEQCGRRNS